MKKFIKSLIAVICLIACTCTTVFGYNFPQPDWARLLRQRETMVKEVDFDLYAEAPITSAPFYWAKFEPIGGTYIGSVPENASEILPLGSYLTYVQDMWQDDLYYPANQMIWYDSVVALIGWTITDLDAVDYDQVRNVLENLNSYNKPLFVRFANEMNCSPIGDEPQKYIEVFRNVANMIHEYPNLAVVWSPNDMGSLDRPFEYYYPGDEYVDWVAVSNYTTRYFLGDKDTDYKSSVYFMTGDYGWPTNKLKPFMEFLEKNNINKPVMVSEGGVETSNIHGDDDRAWATPRLRNMLWSLIMKYPQIKMVNYFNVSRPGENQQFMISGHQYALDIFNEAKNNGAYITRYGTDARFVFKPANEAGTLKSKNGIINLYTLAYFPNQQDVSVTYYLDGAWFHSASQIPFKCSMDISGLADGAHTIRIASGKTSKDYTFYKSGKLVCFGGQPDPSQYAIYDIEVIVNEEELQFDQPPVIVNDRVLVPLRAIFEALGAYVSWDEAEGKVVASIEGTVIELNIGQKYMMVNDNEIEIDVPAQIINDRTLIPVRAVSEAFGCYVEWNGDTKTVIINK